MYCYLLGNDNQKSEFKKRNEEVTLTHLFNKYYIEYLLVTVLNAEDLRGNKSYKNPYIHWILSLMEDTGRK